jgi:UDP-N-acetylmuramate dehydrogenase
MTDSKQSFFTLDQDVALSRHTTIGLGGRAAYFAACDSVEAINQLLFFAGEKGLRVQVLGDGSNIIFPDEGYPGVVLQVGLKGVAVHDNGEHVLVTAAAGEEWDGFVQSCIEHDLAGVECLSGIPGRVGATPIQNVGAYGQEVSNTIVALKAIERKTLREREFQGRECTFGYRHSRFKSSDTDRYIITEVTFRLQRYGEPEIRYPELRQHLESTTELKHLEPGRAVLSAVRQAVLTLRKKKSMVINPSDPHARSVGSFFVNPILTKQKFQQLLNHWKDSGRTEPIPAFPAGEQIKVPAAWLVEHAGFRKGYRLGGVGISANHALALVNYGSTTRELLDLASRIENGVFETFAIRLIREPVVVQV